MRDKLGTACMILGASFVLAALSLFLYNHWEDRKAGRAVEEILPCLLEKVESKETLYSRIDGMEIPEVELDGYFYIGCLSVPALGLELPVMDEWSYPGLKIAPCRYCGSAMTNDLVIAAHNYSRHFGNIKNLSPGDTVYFIDAAGTVFVYEVAELDVLAPMDVEEMTAGGYDLTLFTCTYGGQSRITVRCSRAEDAEN